MDEMMEMRSALQYLGASGLTLVEEQCSERQGMHGE
jgi:hypothetical protein